MFPTNVVYIDYMTSTILQIERPAIVQLGEVREVLLLRVRRRSAKRTDEAFDSKPTEHRFSSRLEFRSEREVNPAPEPPPPRALGDPFSPRANEPTACLPRLPTARLRSLSFLASARLMDIPVGSERSLSKCGLRVRAVRPAFFYLGALSNLRGSKNAGRTSRALKSSRASLK